MNKAECGKPFSKLSEKYAAKFDAAVLHRDREQIEKLLNEVEDLVSKENALSQARLYYSMGTVYGDLMDMDGFFNEKNIKKQLYYFRRSIDLVEESENIQESFAPYILEFKNCLYTNYANTLSSCGRFIAAIAQYKKVLNITPDFGMAAGNLGREYRYYGNMEYVNNNKHYFHQYAYLLLNQAITSKDPNTHEEAKGSFRQVASEYDQEYIDKVLSKNLPVTDTKYDDYDEHAYRKWGVENVLFLNTLNDLPINGLYISEDDVQLPNMIVSIDAKPVFHGMFNQIKQEYVYARYLYYCSLQYVDKPYYADKNTHLINLTDYPQYGIRIEQLKSSYKTLFGIFDKVAFLLNAYFNMKMHEKDVNFKNIWLSGMGGKHSYDFKNTLDYKSNLALAALHWISIDFYDKIEASPNPRLKRIRDVRNALEHKYVKIINGWLTCGECEEIDDCAFYISEEELSKLTLELLHIMRETIIYLTFCINIEERKKAKTKDQSKVVPVNMYEYPDDWKR